MVEKFVRIKATDGVKLCGIFYIPNETSKKTVIHVHGLAGNFYVQSYIKITLKNKIVGIEVYK